MWYHNNTALWVTHKTQLCQLPTKYSSVSYPRNTALSITHNKQYSSVSYPQNTALSVTHKTTWLCQLPTKQHGYPQNCLVEHEQGQQYSHRWEPLVPGPGRTAALQWWSYASTQCLHLLGKTHIIIKHQHSVYICQRKKKEKNYHQASTQCLHLLKKCLYFLSCNICHKIHYL